MRKVFRIFFVYLFVGNSADVKCDKMELVDLIGVHTLTGVSTENIKIKNPYYTSDDDYYDETYDASVISFILDGVTYTAVEDHNDGYRSAMAHLKINEYECKNTFAPIKVLGIHIDQSGSYDRADLLYLFGMNGKKVLEVGTANSDDYYPSFVSNFNPVNIPIS